MDSVLVLDGEQRAALAVVRSLSSRRITTLTSSAHRDPIAARAQGLASVLRNPSAELSASRFQSWLGEQIQHRLLPVTDVTTPFCLSGDVLASYNAVSDKFGLLELARAVGVSAPQTVGAVTTADAIRAVAARGFPATLKPARSRVRLGDQTLRTSVRIVRNRFELDDYLSAAPWLGEVTLLVQEFIPGHGAGVFCLYDRDHAVAWFAHKRIREKPPSGGVSVLCESVPVDPVLKDYAERLLRAAEYRGVAMVEFRIGTDGKPYLMEVNARFWGSLQLAIDCGVDFPWLYYQMLMGENVEPVTSYEVGRRLRWFLGDVDNLILQARDPALSWRTKAAALGRFIGTTFDPKSHNEVFRWSDPGPGLLELRQWVAGVMGRT